MDAEKRAFREITGAANPDESLANQLLLGLIPPSEHSEVDVEPKVYDTRGHSTNEVSAVTNSDESSFQSHTLEARPLLRPLETPYLQN